MANQHAHQAAAPAKPPPATTPAGAEAPPTVTPTAITPGTAVVSTTTIDALFTALFATRTNTQGTISAYLWSDPVTVMGVYTDGSCVMAHFEARAFYPCTIRQ